MSKKKRIQRHYRRKRIKEIIEILKKNEIYKGITPERVKMTIADLGPVYIKLGQIASMRRDLLPKEYCDTLMELQTNINPIDFETILEELENEYGRDPYEIFESIDKEPLGSASIAQAHRAVLKSGEEVVIKVQKPGIYEIVAEDMDILWRASKMLDRLGPKETVQVIDFQEVLKEMWKTAKQEMDFTIEEQNANRFYKLNQSDKHIDSPVIYTEYTTPRVLVMNYISGTDIDQLDQLEKEGYDLDKLALRLTENYIKQIVDDGFFHADPHPGNIRVHDEEIAWIDLGMMGSLSEHDRKTIKKALTAIALNNPRSLEQAFLEIGVHDGEVDEVKLREQIRTMLNNYRTQDIDKIDLEKMFEEIVTISAQNNIQMPSEITMLFRGIVTLESVLLTLSPSMNMISIMRNYLNADRGLEGIREKVSELTKEAYVAGEASLQLPVSLNDFLNLITRGNAKINIAITGSEKPLAALANMVNRLVMGIITAALLIGSSFITTTNMNPKILGIPALGVIGYVSSAILGFWIVLQMLRQDRNLDKEKKKKEKEHGRQK